MPVRKKAFAFVFVFVFFKSAKSFAHLSTDVKLSHGDFFTLFFIDPALLVPGVVPLDEPFGALQLGVQAVLLTPVPGHALGGDDNHLLLAVRVLWLHFQLLHVAVTDLGPLPGALALGPIHTRSAQRQEQQEQRGSQEPHAGGRGAAQRGPGAGTWGKSAGRRCGLSNLASLARSYRCARRWVLYCAALCALP